MHCGMHNIYNGFAILFVYQSSVIRISFFQVHLDKEPLSEWYFNILILNISLYGSSYSSGRIPIDVLCSIKPEYFVSRIVHFHADMPAEIIAFITGPPLE